MANFYSSLSVIIVVYKVSLEESVSFQSIKAMKRQGAELDLFIYDNSPDPQQILDYSDLRITYKHDPMNSGVSKAYNLGVDHAHKLKKRWVLLLDQDTRLPDTILGSYDATIRQQPKINMIVPILKLKNGKIFSPCSYSCKRGFYLNTIASGRHSLYRYSPVNSGMLVNIPAFLKVGGYNNAVKLDFSDFQFIERYRKIDPEFAVMDVVCEQDFSDDAGSLLSQAARFKYFCEGARNIEKEGIWDWIQYNTIVLIRAVRLCWRHRNVGFIKTYFKFFLASGKVAN